MVCVLRRLVERSIEKQKDIYACFIDFSQAFDTVKHDPLIELLQYFATGTRQQK